MEPALQTQHWRELTADEAHALDELAAKRAQSIGRRGLDLGEALSWMERHGGAQKLGYPDIGTYGHETIQKTKRWGEDFRRLYKRLGNLPILWDAFVRGVINVSMAELLARTATPDNEAELLEQARRHSVREMRALLRKTPVEPETERSTVTATVDMLDHWQFERTRKLVEAITGSPSSDELAEALLAEGMTRLINDLPGLDLHAILTLDARLDTRRAQMSVSREEREAERDATRARRSAEDEAEEKRWSQCPDATDPRVLDDHIVSQLRSFVAVEVKLSHVLRRLVLGQPWGMLGYDSLAQYARERLGMSEATARARADLAYSLQKFPGLEAALLSGRVGLEGARMVGRIAEDVTLDAWIARAAERTVKQLREDVEASSLLSSLKSDRRLTAPPDEEVLETVHELEREVLGGLLGEAPAQMSVDEVEVPRGGPKRVIKLSMREDLAILWRTLERIYARVSKGSMPFVTFLCQSLWDSWQGSEAHRRAYAFNNLYLRDRFRCMSPVCSRRDVSAHHVTFRAHGGGDEPGNLVALCSACHLEGVHRGHIEVTGGAPHHLRWSLGRGRLVVEGRRKVTPRLQCKRPTESVVPRPGARA